MAEPLSGKIFYKIGEVAELVGVKTHVLRYWETEFPSFKPLKSRTNQRLYRQQDIDMALQIKTLLYQQGFTVSGARQRLRSSAKVAVATPGLDQIAVRLIRLRDHLRQLCAQDLQ